MSVGLSSQPPSGSGAVAHSVGPSTSGDRVPEDSTVHRVPDMHGDDRVPDEHCDIDCETGESINEDSSPVPMETSDTDTPLGDTMEPCTNLITDTTGGKTRACDNSVCDSQSGASLQTEAPSEHQSDSMSQQTKQFISDSNVHSSPHGSESPSQTLHTPSVLDPISVDTTHHHVTFDLREFHDFPRVTPPSSTNSPSATLTADEVPPDSLSDLSDLEGGGKLRVKFSLGTASPVKLKKKPKYFPVDLKAVLEKVNKNEYVTVVSVNKNDCECGVNKNDCECGECQQK